MARKNRLPPPTGVMVTCKVCGETKDETLFPYSRGKRNGYTCRVCNLAEKKRLYAENESVREAAKRRAREAPLKKPEQYKESRKRYRDENAHELLPKKRAYQQANKERENQRCRDWYQANKDTDEYKAYMVEYRKSREDYIKEYNRRRYLENKHIWLEASKKRRAEKPWMNTYYTRKYNTLKAKSLPPWANLDAIRLIYKNRPKGFAVDHIIPLQGKLVCGLHVENNLQYLTKEDNSQKHCKFNPDTFDPYYQPSGWGLGNWDNEKQCCKMPPDEYLEQYFRRGWHPLFEDTEEYNDMVNNEGFV